MKLDLKKFKKIDFDDKQTLLEHDDGHHLKIAHKGLSKEYRQELDEMPVHKAKGGYSKWAQKYDPNMKAKASKVSQVAKPKTSELPYSPPKMAKNAFTEPDDAGPAPDIVNSENYEPDIVIQKALNRTGPPFGPIGTEKPMYPPCINPSCKSRGRSHPNCRCYGGNGYVSEKFAEGGGVDYFCSKDRPHQKDCEYFAFGSAAPIGNSDSEPMPQQTPVPSAAPAPTPDNYVQPANQITGTDAPEYHAPDSLPPTEEQQAVPQKQLRDELMGQTNDKKSSKKKDTLGSTQKTVDPNTAYQTVKNFLTDEDQSTKHDIDQGWIHPKTYGQLMSESALGKIGSVFGLMLGGAGAALGGGPNVLLEMMNKEIQNDLEAQQKQVGNRQNLVKLSNDTLANNASINSVNANTEQVRLANYAIKANRIVMGKLASIASTAGPRQPEAQALLQQMYPIVDANNAFLIDRAASGVANQNAMHGYGPQAGGGVNYQKLNQLQMNSQMKIPGSPSEQDLGAMKSESSHLEQVNALEKDYQQAFKKLDKMYAAGSLTPNQRTAILKGLEAKAAPVVGVNHAGSLVESMMPQASDWGKTRETKKQSNQQYFNVLKAGTPTLRRFGLINEEQGIGSPTGHESAKEWLQKNPNHPKAKYIRKILGQ